MKDDIHGESLRLDFEFFSFLLLKRIFSKGNNVLIELQVFNDLKLKQNYIAFIAFYKVV